MKIRTGFVSNSSSSSFMIYGIMIDHSKFTEMFKTYLKEGYDYVEPDDVITRETGLTWLHTPDGEDQWCIGRSWDDIKDDETGRQFKADVETKLSKLGLNTTTIGTKERAWYNG